MSCNKRLEKYTVVDKTLYKIFCLCYIKSYKRPSQPKGQLGFHFFTYLSHENNSLH